MIINASKKYREAKNAIESEMKAPRKIIGWLIGVNAIEAVMLVYIIWRIS